jgi:beta-galactosidase
MQPITFTSQCYRIAGQPVYLVSGEFHYFRVPKSDWRKRMRLFKEAGGNCLATYVPWLLHEPVEGHFRFSGEDWLDLEGFLQTASAEGLYVIARPGPYQYSELIYHGLPGWLIQNYPEVLALTAAGETIGYASVSYTHPLFLSKVESWFHAVLPLIARYTLARGGPIAFVQIDNELVGIHEWFGSLDYHPLTMGIGQPGGAYPRFLEHRYTQLDELNQAYASAYTTFAAVEPIPGADQPADVKIRRRKDYFDFYLGTIAEYAARLVDLIRAHGIETPILHNSGNPGMNAYFLETAARLRGRLGNQFLLGSDHYYNLDQNWAQNHPTPQYAVKSFISLEMLRLMGFPPSVLEIPGGSASNWPPVLPGDALAAYLTNLALGMKGSNYYIFTGGPNPPGAGNTTDLYDYDASISATGEIRPLYAAQQEFGLFTQQHPDWLTARRLMDFRVGLDFEYQRSGQYWNERGPFLFSNNDAAAFLRQGLLSSAFCAGLSPEMVDLGSEAWVSDPTIPLAIISSISMSAAKQQRIIEYLRHGGKALIAPILPALDEQLQPCTLLADFLGSPQQARSPHGLARPRIGSVVNVNGTSFPFSQVPPTAQVIGVDEFSAAPLALAIAIPGGGQVILLGLQWIQAMREHERMLAELLTRLGLTQAFSARNPNVWATAYTAQDKTYIFLLNLFTQPQDAELSLSNRRVGTYTIPPVSVQVVITPTG